MPEAQVAIEGKNHIQSELVIRTLFDFTKIVLIIQINGYNVKHIQYSDFDQIKEIRAGGYGTVYTAKYKRMG